MVSSSPFLPKIHRISLLFSFFFISPVFPKSVIEPCNSSSSCTSLLAFRLPSDLKISEIAQNFHCNAIQIMFSNSIDPSTPLTQIVPAYSVVRVPVTCSCVDGIRRSVSTVYTVQPIDTLDSIAIGFGGLVSSDQIRNLNGISAGGQAAIGSGLRIPLPCTCFNGSDNGVPSVFLSYVVREGENLSSVAAGFGSTVADLISVNQLGNAVVFAGDIVSVPIPVCTSANMNLYTDSLSVPNGSYALTAFNCIQCICRTTDLQLECAPSAVQTCSNLQCKGSNLFIGDVYQNQTSNGCYVTSCLYRGYLDHAVLSSLKTYVQPQCTGNHSNLSRPPPLSTSSFQPNLPFPASPSPLATIVPNSNTANVPSSKQTTESTKSDAVVQQIWLGRFVMSSILCSLFL